MKPFRSPVSLNKYFIPRAAAGFFVLSALGYFLLFPFAGGAWAVPAAPEPVELSQADGAKVKVFLKGDEFHNWNEDEGGYAILKDTTTRNWVYAEKDQKGAMRKTAHMVGRADPGSLGLSRHLLDDKKISAAKARRKERDSFRSKKRQGPASAPSISISGAQPLKSAALPAGGPQNTLITAGTLRNLVILARFSDQTPVNTQAEFNSLFNDIGYTLDGAIGSVRDFYNEVSYGKITMQSTVSQWVNLPNTAAFYGAGNPDANPRQMVIDAINALDATGFDFSTMDGNADGEVDGLDIIHSGGGQEFSGNSANYIWSHQWELAAPVTKDGVTMQLYHTEAERRGWDSIPSTLGLARIGVICHETGHFLGLPDLYDYDGDSEGIGDFCLMAGGSWNGTNGTSPAHPSAYCKSRLGWVTPATLSASGSYSLPRIEDSDTAMYKFSGAGFPATEYFLMENKQGFGFDAALPGTTRGILIWHVDEAIADVGANDDQLQYKVDLEEASGTQHLAANTSTGDDNDYFRSGTLTVFNDTSIPNSKSYGNSNLAREVSNISVSGNTMTFNFAPPGAVAPGAIAYVYDGTGADITYVNSLTQLSSNWAASVDSGGIARYWYAIGTTSGGTDIKDWTDNGLQLSTTTKNLSLANGQIYYVSVKAENLLALMSAVATSNGQRVDNTPPSVPGAVIDGTGSDITYVASTSQLSANWTAATDAESGILKYWYAIGTTAGATNTTGGWINNGTATSVTKLSLTLTQAQTYYFTVKAENGVNLESAAVNSNGQRVDITPPLVVAQVRDGPGADGEWFSSPLSANWSASSDPESGIVKYYYAVGTSQGATNVVGWTDNGALTSATATGITIADSQAYYFTVMAENGSGLSSSPANSNGQTSDKSAPSAPSQVNDGTGADITYINSLSGLSANWAPSADDQSGIARYLYAIGTTAGAVNIKDWTDNGLNTSTTAANLVLNNGQPYYFTIKAENRAGLESPAGNSNGQTADTTGPSAPSAIKDGLGADVSYTTSTTQLSANWVGSADGDSGIARYWYAIGTAAGGTNIADWADNGANTSVTRTGLSLNNLATYYFTVKAENGVGLQSAAANSNGLETDALAPTETLPVIDGTGLELDYVSSLNTLSAHWAASFQTSGIAEYFYAIGTATGAVNVAGWTSAGTATGVTRTGLALAEGATYYFTVKSRSNHGYESLPASSNGQKVDTTSPTVKVELASAPPLKSGAFTAVLTLNEASPLASSPSFSFTPYGGSARSLALSQVSSAVWSAAGFIDSVCSTGTAAFAFSARDLAGNTGASITSGTSFAIDTSVSSIAGGTVQNEDGSGVIIPPAAYPSTLWMSISTAATSVTGPADLRTYNSVPLRASNLSMEFGARDAGGVQVSTFNAPVVIRVAWPDADNDGRVDGDYLRENLLQLYYLDPAPGKWVPVEGARRNTALNTIEADVSHFSVYSIRSIYSGDRAVSDIKAYPNPCYMRSGGLTISGIPVDSAVVRISIYNAAGELVRTLKQGDGIDAFNIGTWDGRNSSGAKAASGLYLYVVKTDNHGKATGKFVILW